MQLDVSEQEGEDGLPLFRIIRNVLLVPSTPHHRRRRQHVDARKSEQEGIAMTRDECVTDPFDDLSEVIWVGDILE